MNSIQSFLVREKQMDRFRPQHFLVTRRLSSSFTPRCWGKSFRGQLGRGEYYARGKYPGEMGTGLVATDLGTNATASSLAAGGDHTCAALGDGSLKVRGKARKGKEGKGSG